MKFIKTSKGSITVAFSILLVLIMAVVVTCFDLSGRQAEQTWAETAQEAAVESVFAGYYLPLWEDYHLMFMADGAALESLADQYLLAYETADAESGTLSCSHKEVKTDQVMTATDEDGACFLKEIENDMKIHTADSVLEKILPYKSLLKDAGSISDFMKKISSVGDRLTSLQRQAEEIRKKGRNLKDSCSSLSEYLEQPGWSETEAEVMLSKIQKEAEELSGKAQSYTEASGKNESALDEDVQSLQDESEGIEDPTASQFVADEKAEIESCEQDSNTADFAAQIQNICGQILEIPSASGENTDSDSRKQQIQEVMSSVEKLSFDDTVSSNGEETESAGQSLLSAMKEWKTKGILAILLPAGAEISAAETEKTDRPSKLADSSDGDSDSISLSDITSQLTACQYMTLHFSDFTSETKGKVLSYEAEYILCGKNSDRENLKQTAEKIFALRSGMNLIFLLGDTGKQAEAEAMAVSVSAGNPVLEPLMKGLILCAWSMAEAVSDSKILYSGGNVPIIKKSSDWKISLMNAAGILNSSGASASSSVQSDDGWNYSRYLQILYLLQNKELSLFRMMDVIEENLQQEDAGFLMENCIYGCTLSAEFASSRQTFQKSASYSYGNAED